jgi:hypothetical protein
MPSVIMISCIFSSFYCLRYMCIYIDCKGKDEFSCSAKKRALTLKEGRRRRRREINLENITPPLASRYDGEIYTR